MPDVGGWFRTALDQPTARRIQAWEPTPGEYGHISPPEILDQAAATLVGKRTAILTGAGMSTDSGLPDYRGRDAVPRSPMTFQEFTSNDLSRRRYWARSAVGWAAFQQAQPNQAHFLVAQLADVLDLTGVITQNVDQLHQAAGSARVVDLHGRLATLSCLTCHSTLDRAAFQAELLQLNPDVAPRIEELAHQAATLPDGDAEVDNTHTFAYPSCACGGVLKPDVVYFGENADPATVAEAFDVLQQAEALLVLGTSLSVMSGLRFVRRAVKEGKPVVIITDGPTRGDDLATVRVHGRLEPMLRELLQRLTRPGSSHGHVTG